MLLDESASRKVIQALSEELGLGLFETAEGIIEVANSIMARGIRYVTTDRGHDFKEFSLVAFGGAAPVQVIDIADMLGIKEIIIPPSPGVFSAFGFLVADLAHHYVKTSFSICSETSLEKVEKIFRGLEELGAYQLDKDNVSHQDRWIHRSLDMRYIGQSHELNVPVDWPIDMKKVIDRFHSIHLSRYGYSMKNEVVAIVSYRLIALGLRTKPQLIQVTRNNSNISAEKGSRLVHLKDEGFVECFEYERLNLKAGDLIEGPCLIEEWDTTTVIKKGFTGLTDSYGNLIISKGGG
jgi:N-methylhydantoinase A